MLTAALALLALLIAWRAEHVWASNVWIARHGEEFERRAASKEFSSKKGKKERGERRLTEEDRWRLYQETGGARLPWLPFGIRSYGLVVAAKNSPPLLAFVLKLIRLAWLNWAFPIWTGCLLLIGVFGETNSHQSALLLAGAIALGVNTIGTVVGSVIAMLAMGGLSRHHPTWARKDSAANAVAEFGFSVAAMGLALFATGIFVATLAVKYDAAEVEASSGWLETFFLSMNTATAGATGTALELDGPWGLLASFVSGLVLIVLSLALLFTLTSTWRHAKVKDS